MPDLNKLFQNFNTNITLTKAKSDNLKKGRDSLRDTIIYWFSDHDKKQPNFCWQGSFAMKTTINPLKDGEFDLDDGVYINGYSDLKKEDWIQPSTAHDWIKESVEGHTSTKPIDKSTCVRVQYSANYHIDFPCYIMKNDIAYLAHKTKGWIESDPKALVKWFRSNVNDKGEQLRRVVKYLKAWKDFNTIQLKGVEITILATKNFDGYEDRDDKSLRNTVDYMISDLEYNFKCNKPVVPYEDLFEDASENKKNNVINGLKKLKEKLSNAIDEKDELTASNIIIGILGDRFPKGVTTKSTETNYVKTSAPGVLKHDGRSA